MGSAFPKLTTQMQHLDPLKPHARWHLDAVIGADGEPDPEYRMVKVCTARGTGPRAYSWSVLHVDLVDDRRWLAHVIREVRGKAMRFRRDNPTAATN